MKMSKTNFPKQGDNLAVTLQNSNYPQFDFEFALEVKKNCPIVFKMGKAKNAFKMWQRAREGEESDEVQAWIRKRETYIEKNINRSDIPGLIALMKYGGIAECGIVKMKDIIRSEVLKFISGNKKLDNKIVKSDKKVNLTRRELLEKSIRDAMATGGEKQFV
mgnify:CR=1 FL=1